MPEVEESHEPRSLWSGTISFGLVSIPVNLYPATRTERMSLRMLSPDGTPLRREFYCPAHEQAVSSEKIVRGFQSSQNEFVVVSDEELEALAPEKSRDIDLRRFVPLAELNPMFFERAHFMTPSSESTKAYRLLAEVLEATRRAGIATFVMRGKEYLVAILSEGGLLRAETLRFSDELRSPEHIGLPPVTRPKGSLVRELRKEVKKLTKPAIDASELEDRMLTDAERLVQRKQRSGEDVIQLQGEQREAQAHQADIIDLMEVLKRSLAGTAESSEDKKEKAGSSTNDSGRDDDPSALTKKELYERAQSLDIQGRSQMSKPELVKALRRAARPARRASG